MVHAGLLPSLDRGAGAGTFRRGLRCADGADYRDFLANMWGSEPAAWSDDLAGWDRLRVVVNAMTRMRYVTAAGAMEFRAAGAKAPPDKGPADCLPWFEVPHRASADHLIVCGHWSALGFRDEANMSRARYRLPLGWLPDGGAAGRPAGIPPALPAAGETLGLGLRGRSVGRTSVAPLKPAQAKSGLSAKRASHRRRKGCAPVRRG
jgi:diadenosine tetraphosphatase ApaH/serine/threonine PP2A family protein phosphatase